MKHMHYKCTMRVQQQQHPPRRAYHLYQGQFCFQCEYYIYDTWTKHIPPVGNRDEMKVHNINKLRECIRDVVKLLSLDNHFVVCFSVIYATMLFILTTGWVVVFICERMCRAAVSLSYVYTLYSKPIYWDNWIIRWISHWFLSKLLSHVGIWREIQ